MGSNQLFLITIIGRLQRVSGLQHNHSAQYRDLSTGLVHHRVELNNNTNVMTRFKTPPGHYYSRHYLMFFSNMNNCPFRTSRRLDVFREIAYVIATITWNINETVPISFVGQCLCLNNGARNLIRVNDAKVNINNIFYKKGRRIYVGTTYACLRCRKKYYSK